ncbi:MAG: ATP-grasp domain-containing protein [Hamadaea sp.]|uniref:ATP-grasp domain-containing protein n=1 Tax=Hamadaea sp. TaxID=2024425 RepID=UPI00185CBF79|nr:ATP-grasp domain-containing protein [Hamadaea sp.]NUT19785.1 ATP-grasp domain-containing protein [Hamadaea sp.]
MNESADQLPRVAVVYDVGAASPSDIWRAARGVCDLVFVADGKAAERQGVDRLLRRLGEFVNVDGLSSYDVAAVLEQRGIAGITTFSEPHVRETADYAQRMGMAFHSTETAHRLTHKPSQRRVLAEAGVDVLRYHVIRAVTDVQEAVAHVGLPAVLKPESGAGSRDTVYVGDRAAVHAQVAQLLPRCAQPEALVLEEYLEGDPTVAGPAWGDYVSVESVVNHGAVDHFALLGKLPLAPPFRESGMFVPATIEPETRQRILILTDETLRALGVAHGVVQTELKLTAQGPRIIEVNGRLGGYVADIVRRSAQLDPVRIALEAALGRRARLPAVTLAGVTFQFFIPAPVGSSRIRSIGRAESTPLGITRIEVKAGAGDVVDSDTGTLSYLGVVAGQVPSHDDLAMLWKASGDLLKIEFEDGKPASDRNHEGGDELC